MTEPWERTGPWQNLPPAMFYFGPWDRSGHFVFDEHGQTAYGKEDLLPWKYAIDGVLQPGCRFERGRWDTPDEQPEGEAVLHHKDGWTALSFWDRTVDKRFGSNSNYFAAGIFTFEQMVEMAKARFPKRWGMMKFEVRPYQAAQETKE